MCVKYEIRPIVVSKILDFDKQVADLIKKSNGTLHISLGIDALEKGAVLQGASFSDRVQVAKEYTDYGVNCSVRVVADIAQPMTDNVKKVKELGLRILLTPLYYLKKDLFTRTDMTWDEAKTNGTYYWNHGLHPKKVHPDWDTTKERCGYIDGKCCCNNCGLGKIYYSDEVRYNKKLYKKRLITIGWNNEV